MKSDEEIRDAFEADKTCYDVGEVTGRQNTPLLNAMHDILAWVADEPIPEREPGRSFENLIKEIKASAERIKIINTRHQRN